MLGKSDRARKTKPVAHKQGVTVTQAGDKTLVYDRERFVIHRLRAVAAAVWRLPEGILDSDTISVESDVRNVDVVVNNLTAMKLITGETTSRSLWTRRPILACSVRAAVAETFISPVAASDRAGVINGPPAIGWTGEPCGANEEIVWRFDSCGPRSPTDQATLCRLRRG